MEHGIEFVLPSGAWKLIPSYWKKALLDSLGNIMLAEGIVTTCPIPHKLYSKEVTIRLVQIRLSQKCTFL